MPFVKCPKRIVVDGRLAAYEGQLLTPEQAEALGIAPDGKEKPEAKKAPAKRSQSK